MQFGWLTLALSPAPEEDAARIDDQIAQVCYAEELGFSDVWLTEHYFTGESVYNDALLFAAALAMRTTRIRTRSLPALRFGGRANFRTTTSRRRSSC